jgi:hypothetical protein
VDQDVPVITVKSGSDLKAIVFGYSCHTTALGGLSINGDYAGFAQLELEKSFPGSVALFVQNCGGDANPLPRIRGKDVEATELAGMYGKILAEAVVDYSLKFKAAYGWNNTWVCGYNNDLLSYVPSLRVLKEGGYEGVTGMFEYGHRAPYTETVEERITTKVEELVKATAK